MFLNFVCLSPLSCSLICIQTNGDRAADGNGGPVMRSNRKDGNGTAAPRSGRMTATTARPTVGGGAAVIIRRVFSVAVVVIVVVVCDKWLLLTTSLAGSQICTRQQGYKFSCCKCTSCLISCLLYWLETTRQAKARLRLGAAQSAAPLIAAAARFSSQRCQ